MIVTIMEEKCVFLVREYPYLLTYGLCALFSFVREISIAK